MAGENDYGELGDGTGMDQSDPVPVPNMVNVVQVSCGFRHTGILKTDGSLWMTGQNAGQLGITSTEKIIYSPERVLLDGNNSTMGNELDFEKDIWKIGRAHV